MTYSIFLFFLLQQGQVFPKLGDPLPTKATPTGVSLMIMAGKQSPAYQFLFFGVRYYFSVDANSRVDFAYVDDPGCILHDGIGVGDSTEKVLKLTGRKAIKENGWAFYIPLFAGWNAAFIQGES